MRAAQLVFVLAMTEPHLTPQRAWLERLAVLVPSNATTRWLLVADAICLIALGIPSRRPALGIPLAIGVGFLTLNVLGMVVTDFYLGLALFHPAVGSQRCWRFVVPVGSAPPR
jgi:hypothetical protein